MKIGTLLVVLLGFLTVSSAQADIGGNWVGWGEWSFQGSGTRCPDVRFSFIETADRLERVSGHFECDMVALDIDPLTIEKRGNDLIVDGRVIGSTDGMAYNWTEYYSEAIKIEVYLKREGNHMDYVERWVKFGNTEIYLIRGRLFISGN